MKCTANDKISQCHSKEAHMNPKRVVIDGKVYNSVEEMPEDVRRNYEEATRRAGASGLNAASNKFEGTKSILSDTDADGLPDFLQNAGTINFNSGMKYVVDGITYDSVDDLPPHARAKYEQAMGALDTNRNGVPDMLEGMMDATPQTRQSAMPAAPPSRSGKPLHSPRTTASPTITPDTSNGWMLVTGLLFLLGICAFGALGIWYFFLR
jgi:hypothetical protein